MQRVALVHGFLGSPADWAEVLEQLPSGIECDCVPLVALGCESIADAARALSERIEQQPCDALVGYSMGGRIALELAATRPELASRFVLLSASPGLDEAHDGHGARARRAAEDDARANEMLQDGIDRFVERWYQLPLFASFVRHPSFSSARLRRAQGEAAFWARAISGCSPGRTAPRWDTLAALASRTILTVGALDERYADLAQRAARYAPLLQVEVVAHAGHVLPLEAPRACARAILASLSSSHT